MVSAKPKRRRAIGALIAALLVVVSYVVAVAVWPLPAPTLQQQVQSGPVDTGAALAVPWPQSKQAALVGNGRGVLAASGDEAPLPMASTAKIITALTVLKEKSLAQGQAGPTITFTSGDVAIQDAFSARNGVVARVTPGGQLTQYEALQAVLIPSANNIAVSLANWAFGSEQAYAEAANTWLKEFGFKHTRVADASGFSPSTVSTARELALLGELAMRNTVIAEIVGQKEATLPMIGKITSTNQVLGQVGIDGIKTGHTVESGGCFVFTATRDIDGAAVRLVGAIMGAPSIDQARAAAPRLLESGFAGFGRVTALKPGATVATVQAPWAEPQPIVADRGLSEVIWRGAPLSLQVSVSVRDQAGRAGTASLGDQETALSLKNSLPQPSLWWRLTHPLELIDVI